MPMKNQPIAKGDGMSICSLYIMNFHTVSFSSSVIICLLGCNSVAQICILVLCRGQTPECIKLGSGCAKVGHFILSKLVLSNGLVSAAGVDQKNFILLLRNEPRITPYYILRHCFCHIGLDVSYYLRTENAYGGGRVALFLASKRNYSPSKENFDFPRYNCPSNSYDQKGSGLDILHYHT